MARKTTRRLRAGSTRTTDKKLIRNVRKEAPTEAAAILESTVSEAEVGTVLDRLMAMSGDERPHFYCRRCGEYHLKTHPHYSK